MVKKFIVLRSLPSGGKSTLAKTYKDKYHDSCFICTTDDYWMRPDGTYDFNYEILGRAHNWNLKRTIKVMKEEMYSSFDVVIVLDNVNSKFNDFRLYIMAALKYAYPIYLVEPKTEWKFNVEECYKRSMKNGRKVPYSTILRMYHEWEPEEVIIRKINELKTKGP